jgi:hypothetical protein
MWTLCCSCEGAAVTHSTSSMLVAGNSCGWFACCVWSHSGNEFRRISVDQSGRHDVVGDRWTVQHVGLIDRRRTTPGPRHLPGPPACVIAIQSWLCATRAAVPISSLLRISAPSLGRVKRVSKSLRRSHQEEGVAGLQGLVHRVAQPTARPRDAWTFGRSPIATPCAGHSCGRCRDPVLPRRACAQHRFGRVKTQNSGSAAAKQSMASCGHGVRISFEQYALICANTC